MNLDKIISENQTMAISGHISPDGDCVGSSLALYNYITTYFPKKEVVVYLEQIPGKFKFLAGASNIQHTIPENVSYDLYFSMDCGALDRLGFARKQYEASPVQCCIDHHISNPAEGAYTYIKADASATCELVYELISHREITQDIAQCLYLGIAHDTGVFQFSNTSPHTMDIASNLLATGISGSDIIENTYYEKTFIQMKLLALGLEKAVLLEEGTCIFTYLTLEEMNGLGARRMDTDGIVSQLRYTKGVDVAIFLYELEPGTYKVSLRSNENVDVSVVATHFQGGGHKKAAGFSLTGEVNHLLEQILKKIRSTKL